MLFSDSTFITRSHCVLRSLALRSPFGRASTGIVRPAQAEPAQTVIYDLSGRRVLTPRRGLYIINNKKVYIQ